MESEFNQIIHFFENNPGKIEVGSTRLEKIETHISVVLITDKFVYKFKKPVDFGFISQLRAVERLINCQRECELNSRLAADVYLGVRGVKKRGRAWELVEELDGALDYCVVMRRLSEDDNLLSRLNSNRIDLPQLRAVAKSLADFHWSYPRGEAQSRLHTFYKNLNDNLKILTESQTITPACSEQISDYAASFRKKIELRERKNRVVDGHGDLRLEHIYLHAETVRIIDCVEFNPQIRAVDPWEDVAFTTMALRLYGRPELADFLSAEYLAWYTDLNGLELLPLYEIYRASVRAKVDLLTINQDNAQQDHLKKRIKKYLNFIQQRLEAPVPGKQKLTIVTGLPATGKSCHARKICEAEPGRPRLNSDVVRKRLFGLAPQISGSARTFTGMYQNCYTQLVYRRMLAAADLLLRAGQSPILDATFSESLYRNLAIRVARKHGAQIEFHLIEAAREIIRQRLLKRESIPCESDLKDLNTWLSIQQKFAPLEFEKSPDIKIIRFDGCS